MATALLGLRTVIYKVSDMVKATRWYFEAFGIEPYFNEPFYVGFNVGGYELGLQPEEGEHEKPESVLAYWGVNDVDAVYHSLLQAGATAHEEPTNVGGDIVVASVKDPWGNILGVIYNPGFK